MDGDRERKCEREKARTCNLCTQPNLNVKSLKHNNYESTRIKKKYFLILIHVRQIKKITLKLNFNDSQ